MLFQEAFPFKGGCTHGDTKGFGFIRASDDTGVIAAKHDDRLVVERRVKNAFTGDVKVIAVDEEKALHGCLYLMNNVGNDSPDFKVHSLGDFNRLVFIAVGHEVEFVCFAFDALNGQFIINTRDDDPVV